MAENQYTGQDAKDALESILKLKKKDETAYTTELPPEEEKIDAVTKTPDNILEVPIGIRDGILKSINPNALDEFYYEVYFEGFNTSVYAKLTFGLGFNYTPEGEWEGDIFRVTEEVKVKIQAIKDSLKWIIVGVGDQLDVTPGTSSVTRGDSQVAVDKDKATVSQGDTILKVDGEWAYINGKKICVEPCGTSGEPCPDPPKTGNLKIRKTVSNPNPMVGEVVTFIITVTNEGPDDLTGVVVRDRFYSSGGNNGGEGEGQHPRLKLLNKATVQLNNLITNQLIG